MKRNAISPIPLFLEGKPCKYLATFDMVRLCHGVERYEIVQGGNVRVFPAGLNRTQNTGAQSSGVAPLAVSVNWANLETGIDS